MRLRSGRHPFSGFLRAYGAASIVALALHSAHTEAADPWRSTFTPLMPPECIEDTSNSFVTENVVADPPPHPTLPNEHFYTVVRFQGVASTAFASAFDFGRIPSDYGWVPMRGQPLTGYTVPQPRERWQRAGRDDATLDTSSAFQLHCRDAGIFINSWTFPDIELRGTSPHAIYGYSFNVPPPPAIFDADPGTDFVLQAAIETPWFMGWPAARASRNIDPLGQVSLFAYVRARTSGKLFAMLFGVFDSRAGAAGTFPPGVLHDGATPFTSTPLNRDIRFGSLSPYSATYTGFAWSGLRFFRVHVSQRDFRDALAAVNAYCRDHPPARFCAAEPSLGLAFDPRPDVYEVTDFGVLVEIFRGDPKGELAMGVHIAGLGVWNAR